MHLLFVLFDFTIVFCFAWDDYVASFCNSPFYFLPYPGAEGLPDGGLPPAGDGNACPAAHPYLAGG